MPDPDPGLSFDRTNDPASSNPLKDEISTSLSHYCC